MAQPPHADFLRQALDQLQRDNGQHPICDDCGNPKVLAPCHACGHTMAWRCPLLLAYAVNKAHGIGHPVHEQHGRSADHVETVQSNEDVADLAPYFHADLWPLIVPMDRALVVDLIERTPVLDEPDPKGPLGHEGLFPETPGTLEVARLILEDLHEDPYDEEVWSWWEQLADGVEPDPDGCFPPKED